MPIIQRFLRISIIGFNPYLRNDFLTFKIARTTFVCMLRTCISHVAGFLVAVIIFLIPLCGCGGKTSAGTPTLPKEAVIIEIPPASATIPLDSTGTFTVQVGGTPPFTYQWNRDGAAIAGATSASYLTPTIESSDNGSTFTVTVSNSVNSVTSSPATLTVGPRSPQPGDLRFQLVRSPWLAQWTTDGPATLAASADVSYTNAFGNPFTVGDEICEAISGYNYCSWAYIVCGLPSATSGLSATFKSGQLANFETDLESIISPQSVIRTLDLRPADGEYAMELVSLTGGQFDLAERVVAPGAIASTVAQDALQSRVITAVSFDGNGQAHLMSYGMGGDSTVYDTQVSIVDPQDVADAAAALAADGFIITAFGGNDTDGYVLVGTKVHGDTMPRPLYVYPQSNRPGRAWTEVLRLTWLEYAPSGAVSSQGNEIILEQ